MKKEGASRWLILLVVNVIRYRMILIIHLKNTIFLRQLRNVSIVKEAKSRWTTEPLS